MKDSSFTILHADDDLDDLFIINSLFHKYADQVTIQHATDGEQALVTLERMKQNNDLPCLIILDVNMPRLNGRETLLQIKSRDELKDIPVVLFTTSNSETDKAFAEEYAADLITKPITVEKMEDVVSDFVRRCQLERAKKA
ncbi:MAG: response regulator [Bacteroidota bacterium]|nr:response regulator [Bacteroidota bacterium]